VTDAELSRRGVDHATGGAAEVLLRLDAEALVDRNAHFLSVVRDNGGMFVATQPIVLTEEERAELESRARARSLRSSDTQRAKIILQLADGASFRGAAVAAGCSQMTVNV
jgi:hypothetical protein